MADGKDHGVNNWLIVDLTCECPDRIASINSSGSTVGVEDGITTCRISFKRIKCVPVLPDIGLEYCRAVNAVNQTQLEGDKERNTLGQHLGTLVLI
jgi:hypothetical protein